MQLHSGKKTEDPMLEIHRNLCEKRENGCNIQGKKPKEEKRFFLSDGAGKGNCIH